jgi:hypothetical protein
MASKAFMASKAVRFALMTPTALLAKTEKRKDYADHDNKTDQIDDSVHEIPPVSVPDPPESNVLPNRKFRDSSSAAAVGQPAPNNKAPACHADACFVVSRDGGTYQPGPAPCVAVYTA